jgi:hypothetical protein
VGWNYVIRQFKDLDLAAKTLDWEYKQQAGRLADRGEILDVSKVDLNRTKFQAVKQSPCTA